MDSTDEPHQGTCEEELPGAEGLLHLEATEFGHTKLARWTVCRGDSRSTVAPAGGMQLRNQPNLVVRPPIRPTCRSPWKARIRSRTQMTTATTRPFLLAK